MLHGVWQPNDDRSAFRLVLGSVFLATITKKGGDGIYAKNWVSVLNGKHLAETPDLDLAKGTAEMMNVQELAGLAEAYRGVKARAPTSAGIYPDGAWGRWKALRSA